MTEDRIKQILWFARVHDTTKYDAKLLESPASVSRCTKAEAQLRQTLEDMGFSAGADDAIVYAMARAGSPRYFGGRNSTSQAVAFALWQSNRITDKQFALLVSPMASL